MSRPQFRTLLIMGEGSGEEIFLTHLKACYDNRYNNQRTTIRSASGGSPKSIIQNCIKFSRNAEFNKKIVLLDSDIPVDPNASKLAALNKIEILKSVPNCLDCMILELMGKSVKGLSSSKCKSKLSSIGFITTDKKSYVKHLPEKVLDAAVSDIIIYLIKQLSNSDVD